MGQNVLCSYSWEWYKSWYRFDTLSIFVPDTSLSSTQAGLAWKGVAVVQGPHMGLKKLNFYILEVGPMNVTDLKSVFILEQTPCFSSKLLNKSLTCCGLTKHFLCTQNVWIEV